ncbi:MAG: alpha amylase C-terminal domain-containing protein, partial [Micrococcales bacterium]
NSKASAAKLTGLATGMKPGTYCDLISGGNKPIKVKGKSCVGTPVVVDKAGKLNAAVPAQTAIAIATTSKLK